MKLQVLTKEELFDPFKQRAVGFRLNVLEKIAGVERYKKMHLEETQKIDRELAER